MIWNPWRRIRQLKTQLLLCALAARGRLAGHPTEYAKCDALMAVKQLWAWHEHDRQHIADLQKRLQAALPKEAEEWEYT